MLNINQTRFKAERKVFNPIANIVAEKSCFNSVSFMLELILPPTKDPANKLKEIISIDKHPYIYIYIYK